MKYSKEDLITEYRKLKEELGESPSSKFFYKKTGISKRDLARIFDNYSSLVTACGDIPKEFLKEKSDFQEILIQWGTLARHKKQIPLQNHWLQAGCNPTADNIRLVHKILWKDIPYKFLEYAAGKEEWKDVIDLIPPIKQNEVSSEEIDVEENVKEKSGSVYLIKSGKYYKIGRAKHIGGREYQLSIQLPQKAETIHHIETDDMIGIEKYWHIRFADKRKNGEWFDLTKNDISAFKKRKFM